MKKKWRIYLLKGKNRQSLILTRLWIFRNLQMVKAITTTMVMTQKLRLRGMVQQGALAKMPGHLQLLITMKIAITDLKLFFVPCQRHRRNQRPQKPPKRLSLTSETWKIRLQTLIKLHQSNLKNFVVQQGFKGYQCQMTTIDTPGHHMEAAAPINQLEK